MKVNVSFGASKAAKQPGSTADQHPEKEKDAIREKGILHHPFLSRHYGPGYDVAWPFSA